MLKTILLATDGSSSAKRASDFAASLAIRFGSSVLVVHAYSPEPSVRPQSTLEGTSPHYQSMDQAQAVLNSSVKRLENMGVSVVELEIIPGPAANVILGAAETHRPDLLVIGARGLSTWQGASLGSVCLSVTQRSEFPVLVVK